MPSPNPLVVDVGSPPIPEVHAWARRYDGEHGPMLDLCQAVPGYPPHPELLEHIATAARDPACAKYGLITGDAPLREAFAHQMTTFYGGEVGTGNVTITAGCNQAFFLAMMTLAQRGDAVLLPTPWFWNHQQTCDMLGIEPRPLPCSAEAGFVPDPAEAEALLDPRVRAIVLVTPNNPTGAVYPPEVIAAFHDLARRRNLWLIMDETYRDFLPEGQERPHELFSDPEWPRNVVQLYSFSKAYCIPGHRLGAVTASPDLAAQFIKVLDCMHICPQRAGQAALLWGLDALAEWRGENRARINRRAEAVRDAFQRLPDWRIESLGAYFAYVRHPFEGVPGHRVVEHLAAERGAMCLPGSAFGAGQEGHLRMAFANVELDGIGQLADRLGSMRRADLR